MILKQKILNFLFLLRYLVALFFISITSFLFFPKFINYEKDMNFINNYLNKEYGIVIKNYSKVGYEAFPFPRLVVKDINFDIEKILEGSNGILILNLNLNNIYQIKKIKLEKITVEKLILNIDKKNLKEFSKHFYTLEKKLIFKDSNLVINHKNEKLINIDKFNLSNKQKKKINFSGEYLTNKISGKFLSENNKKTLNFKIKDLGIESKLIFLQNSSFDEAFGKVKLKLIHNLIIFDFKYKEKVEIMNSYIRNKNFASSFDGTINLKPFFMFDLIFQIKNINNKYIEMIKNKNIVNIKNFLKKINGTSTFIYKNNQSFNKKIINEFLLNLKLENGEVNINKSKIYLDGLIADINLSTYDANNFPKLKFKIHFNFNDTKKFLKNFYVSKKKNIKLSNLIVEGSLNIMTNKVNFVNINIGDSYDLKDEDLTYFKKNFEEIIIQDNIFNLFNKNKIKRFINEVY